MSFSYSSLSLAIYDAALSGVVTYNYLKMRESRANSQPSVDTIPEKLKALLKVNHTVCSDDNIIRSSVLLDLWIISH